MRIGVENGNGAVCDCCGIEIKSKDVVNVHGDMLHKDPHKASTGCMSRLGSCHMCRSCFQRLLGRYIRKPRKP